MIWSYDPFLFASICFIVEEKEEVIDESFGDDTFGKEEPTKENQDTPVEDKDSDSEQKQDSENTEGSEKVSDDSPKEDKENITEEELKEEL